MKKLGTEPVGQELSAIERRESHLWMIALVLLLAFVVATLFVVHLVLVANPEAGAERPSLIPSLISLSVLVVLFCFYVVFSRSSLSRVRRLFEARAVRDPLTGLLNRQSFTERVEREMAAAERNGTILGLLLCDLDDFKRVNDTYGHPEGDATLKRVGQAVLSATRGSDLVFRWGGDEFVVLLSPTIRQGAMAAADRIRKEVLAARADLAVALDISIGVSFYPEHGTTMADLINLADKALYIAKGSTDKIHVGEEELPLDEDAVRLVFQPVVDSASRTTLGYEALSRDPKGGAGVGALFRRYEASGQLADLKRMLFKRQVEEAERLGLPRVFINVDLHLLESYEPIVCPDSVEVVLEISETQTVKGTERSLAIVDEWRKRGFKFGIDDFGSGLVSLPFVAKLFPDFIKMDRVTMLQAGGSPRFGAFMTDLVSAMRNYSQEGIIAERVETEEELAIVRSFGFDQVQGHLTGRPEKLSAESGEELPTPEPSLEES